MKLKKTMVNFSHVHSYEEAYEALENGNNAIKVYSRYEGNERSFSIFTKALARSTFCTILR